MLQYLPIVTESLVSRCKNNSLRSDLQNHYKMLVNRCTGVKMFSVIFPKLLAYSLQNSFFTLSINHLLLISKADYYSLHLKLNYTA